MLQLILAWPLLVGASAQSDAAPAGGVGLKVVFDVANLVGEPAEASFTLELHPEWAPLGAKRVQDLAEAKFFDDVRFFRVIENFMMQFGIHGDPAVMHQWRDKNIRDDKAKPEISNTRGRVSFAMAGPNTRSTQLFINFKDNSFLDKMGFTPLAEVVDGMDVVDRIFKVGEGAPRGPGPSQGEIQSRGNAYLNKDFPQLSYVKSCRIVSGGNSVTAEGGDGSSGTSEGAGSPQAAYPALRDLGDGLKLAVTRAGDGMTFPRSGERLTMHYTLTLVGDTSGKVIDSSRSRNEPFSFTIGHGEVIRGWDLGVMKMSLGERGVLTVPSRLGYGAAGAGGDIPPNADLSFDVEVLQIGDQNPAEAGEELASVHDTIGGGATMLVLALALGVLAFVVCRGVGKRSPHQGDAESKDSV